MTLNTPLDSGSAAVLIPLITFEWGNTVLRLAVHTENMVVDGNTYTAWPNCEITLGEITGGLDSKDSIIQLRNRSDISNWAKEKTAEIQVTISEVVPSDPVNTLRVLFVGWVKRIVMNDGQSEGSTRIEVGPLLGRLNSVVLGLAMSPFCQWTLGDAATCGVNVGPLEQSGVLSLVPATSPNHIRVAGLNPTVVIAGKPSQLYPRLFHRGYVYKDNLRIWILDYEGDGTTVPNETIYLAAPPPAAWVGQTVTVSPGCDKTLFVCQSIYDNEEFFSGLALNAPKYNRTIETGAET